VTAVVGALDPFDVRRAQGATGLLGEFNEAGVLTAGDLRVTERLVALGGGASDPVPLAVALAVRAPRLGSVLVDLATIHGTATVDSDEPTDLSGLRWPDADEWPRLVGASSLVASGEESAQLDRPLRLVDSWLYLDRYWREERQVATDLAALGSGGAGGVDIGVLQDGLARLFGEQAGGRQGLAAATAVLRRLTVIAGGPGTGKTTTVARVVALLTEQRVSNGAPPPLIALAAPTGKAAARLEEAVHEEAAGLAVDDAVRAQLLGLQASTLHRLLGWRPGSHSRFRHDRSQRLPHDVVIVDETSMVSLSLMARLGEAIRPDARLVLVGDPGQLVSIEAGAVLGDIVGEVGQTLRIGRSARKALEEVTGAALTTEEPPAGMTFGDGVVVLDEVHRFGDEIDQLAAAIRRGDSNAVVELLEAGSDQVQWIPVEAGDGDNALTEVRDGAVAAARRVLEAAQAGDSLEALGALGSFRVLCAHRRGAQGVATWNVQLQNWLANEVGDLGGDGRWYAGRPLLITQNDYELGLYNGDTGVVVQADDGRLTAAFERKGEVLKFSPMRLGAADTVYAMTIHKSQGSQFDTAAVLLPGPTSRILTRALLYTAVTRARLALVVAGPEESVRAAVGRPVARATGLRRRLWS
jgi:exodeoxyribonuclease V alpha subunit